MYIREGDVFGCTGSYLPMTFSARGSTAGCMVVAGMPTFSNRSMARGQSTDTNDMDTMQFIYIYIYIYIWWL